MLTVWQLKKALEGKSDDLEIYFRAVSNPCGNIVQAYHAEESTYGFFGTSIPCIIMEPTSPEFELGYNTFCENNDSEKHTEEPKCPFDAGTREATRWNDGFISAKTSLKPKKEATA